MSPVDPYACLLDEAHIWLAKPAAEDRAAEQQQACQEVISAAERARSERLQRPQHRSLYILAHGLLRRALSHYADVDPQDWTFREGPFGRPEIDGPTPAQLRFNLSHTPGLAACIIARTTDCGVDVEKIRRADRRLERADRLLSVEEAEVLGELPPAVRRRRFFVHWTLKEAYLKARGIGLQVEVDQVRFEVSDAGLAKVRLDPELDDRAEDWQFAWFEPTEEHALSVALRVPGREHRRIVVRPW